MDSFHLQEWELWYTFSTFFNSHISNLETVAKRLVELEIVDCAVISDGVTFCRTDDGVLTGKTILNLSGDLKKVSAQFKTNSIEAVELTGYSREIWKIGVQFLYGEARQISQVGKLPTPHIRAFMKPILLIKEEKRITSLYPIIILYQSGILIIEFRMIAPKSSVEIGDFIRNYVNVQRYDYEYAMVPTAISIIAPEVYEYYSNSQLNIFQQLDIIKKKKNQRKVFQSLSEEVDFGDFKFELSPLPNTEDKETLTSVAQTLFGIIGFISKSPISSISLLFKGTPDLPELGNYWIGRPHVHLVQHSNQLDNSSDNEDSNQNFFGQILSRVADARCDFSIYLPKDSRHFEDYGAYITSAITLWVWSKNGLENQQESMDLNRGNLMYEHQIQVELLEYGFMLHKSLLEKSNTLDKYQDILATRRDLADLKSKMLETTPYGEVRDLLSQGWEEMNVSTMQSQISENLSILENEIKFIESKQDNRFRIFLTVFGMLASASFAKSIVTPVWKALNFWVPLDESWTEPFLVSISTTLVVLSVIFLKYFIYR